MAPLPLEIENMYGILFEHLFGVIQGLNYSLVFNQIEYSTQNLGVTLLFKAGNNSVSGRVIVI